MDAVPLQMIKNKICKVKSIMRLFICLFLFSAIISCKDNINKPDVGNIDIPLETYRFERDLFKSDSAHILDAFMKANRFYPSLSDIYLQRILNIPVATPQDTVIRYLNSFTTSFRSIYDSTEVIIQAFSNYETEIKNAMKYVRYYFPDYSLPKKIITFIGPPDGIAYLLMNDALMIGLQQHLGRDALLYKEPWLQDIYPPYISYRFCPEYIQVNCMQSIVEDLFPVEPSDASMSTQMIEAGKRLYLLQRFLPDCKEYLLIGYTEKQLEDCYNHEKVIWSFFIKNNLLQSNDKTAIQNYLGEGPHTQELGEAAPGKIGVFCGWQIVKKFMNNHEDMSLQELMKLDPEKIMQQAKYKP